MTDRRGFLKHTFTVSAGLLILPPSSFAENFADDIAADDLEKAFQNPPSSARPMAFWMWMNGHVTKKGITLDLQTVKEMGLAGVVLYNVGVGIPKGPIEYGSTQWSEMFVHALQEARRLGLELFLHNCPGYSSTGGAKIPPGLGMQQVVWTETNVQSKGTLNLDLPQPLTKLGYYKDAIVVAYPTPEAEKLSMQDALVRLTANGNEIDKNVLFQKAAPSVIEIEANEQVVLEFAAPFEARSISITRLSEPSTSVYDDAFDHAPSLVLESSDDGKNYEVVCTVAMPLLRFLDAPGVQNFSPVKAKFFRLTTNRKTHLTSIDLHAGPRLAGWPGKANFTDIDLQVKSTEVEKEWIIDPATVVNVTEHLQKDGRLQWSAPKGAWTILRFGHTCTGTRTVATPDGAGGLEIDKFNDEAVDAYFRLHLNDLLQQTKSFIGKSFKGLSIDSYEVGKQNWTEKFPAHFQQSRGYDIAVWMPALTGRIVKSTDNTEKFLWDLRRTQADLFAEKYYGAFKKQCAAHGLRFYAEPCGDGVFDGLQLGQYPEVAYGEFWTRNVPGTLYLCKLAASIGHVYGKKIIAAEAYTGMPRTSRWTGYPYALKSQGDYLFSMGINRFIFHVMVHQPRTTGFPGMTMGPYGTHFDRNNTWTKKAKGWVNYLTRSQALLQQGLPVADILYFKGEDPTFAIPDVSYVNPPTPKNLAGDVIGPDVLLNRITIVNNRLVLPDGMQYGLLILAPLKKISPLILAKIKTLVEQGMSLIVTARPTDVPGFTNNGEGRKMVHQLAEELWGDLDGETVKERSYGKGKLYWNKPFDVVLKEHNIKPDFEFTAKNNDAAIHYTHRKIGETDVYFISNHLRRKEHLVCLFRVAAKQPEIWNAETGEAFLAALYEQEEDRTRVPVELEPAGSLFVVFRKKATAPSYQTVSQNSVEVISTKPFPAIKQAPYNNITNNFTISFWAKPDTHAPYPKGVLIFQPEGEVVYGAGHAACGLAAGQNGVRVFEREKGPNHSAREMISYQQSLEGWTHLALRYEEGRPTLFINGKQVGSNESSGKIIHPGLDTPPTDEFFSALFEGNSTKPELVSEALSNDAIERLYQNDLPEPEAPSAITVRQTAKGELIARIWQNGDFQISSDAGKKIIKTEACKIISIDNPWNVHFPPSSGAPAVVRLNKLRSLHRHSDFNVKHFSGTAVYQTSFSFSEKLGTEHCVLLDTGRVEILAEVELNGKRFATLWKEPFHIDITKALIRGTNHLRISVTTLWPNRMIGDEYLPVENEYDENSFIRRFPDWYLQDKTKPGERKTFSVWNDFKKSDPLLEAGLLGPVQLILGVEKIITRKF